MSPTPTDSAPPFFEETCEWLGQRFDAIDAARERSRKRIIELKDCTEGLSFGTTTAFVAFGSVARLEETTQSDIDWSMMVDGPSDLEHSKVSKIIHKRLLERELIEPGSGGFFGGITSSHELLHNIGGLEDTNANMTRRLLLLLESVAIEGDTTRAGVISKLLQRYVLYGKGVDTTDSKSLKPPRFLLNDFVRYWRTIGVDYAAKKWIQDDKKWALRNTKLRFSRKLIFLKGVLMTLDCALFDSEWPWKHLSPDDYSPEQRLQKGLHQLIDLPAIDTLCRIAKLADTKETAIKALKSYDLFLQILDNKGKREHLEKVPFEDASDDTTFREARNAGREFGEALESLLFDSHNKLGLLTKEYGVF